MDTSSSVKSLLSLSGIDSGVTLITNDSLIRKSEHQQREINEKNKRIENLEETVIQLEDVVTKYKKQLSDIKQSQDKPQTSWVKNLVAEKEELKETLKMWYLESDKLIIENKRKRNAITVLHGKLEVLKSQNEEWQAEKENLLLELEEQGKIREELIKDVKKEKEDRDEIDAKRFEDLKEIYDKFNAICIDLDAKNAIGDLMVEKMPSEAHFDKMMLQISASITIASKQVEKLIEENKDMKEETKELQELTEFMNYENQFTIEELRRSKEQFANLEKEKAALVEEKSILEKENATLKMKNACIEEENASLKREKEVLQTEKDSIEKQNANLEENLAALTTERNDLQEEVASSKKEKITLEEDKKLLIAKNVNLTHKSAAMQDVSAILYRRNKIAEVKFVRSIEQRKKVGKIAVEERKKRIRLAKKYKSVFKKNLINQKELAREKKLRNMLGSGNLELQLQLKCLSSEIECLEAERSDAIEAVKNAAIQSLKASELMDENNELEENVKKLKKNMTARQKELLLKEEVLRSLRDDLAKKTNSNESLKTRMKEMATNQKKMQVELEIEKQTNEQHESEIIKLSELIQRLQTPKRAWYKKFFCGCSH